MDSVGDEDRRRGSANYRLTLIADGASQAALDGSGPLTVTLAEKETEMAAVLINTAQLQKLTGSMAVFDSVAGGDAGAPPVLMHPVTQPVLASGV